MDSLSSDLKFLSGGGEAGALIRSLDWSKTAIGPAESWSPSLKMMVSFLLANRFPHLLWWGPEYISIYNDYYSPILGTKHPNAMGLPFAECWPEVQDVLGPLIDTPFQGGPATWMDDIPLEVNRHGFVEETHFTFAYSPVPDDTAPRGIGGVLATVMEITEKVVGERRVAVLRDLGASIGEARTAEEACAIAANILAQHAKDVPFALFYLIEPDGSQARLVGSAGVEPDTSASPRLLDLRDAENGTSAWPVAEVLASGTPVFAEALGKRFTQVPQGPWSDSPNCAVVLPLRSHMTLQLSGFLVAGVSPRLKFDDQYRGFFDLAATQIATAITNARAYEEERKRAEALAEIDRAKTAFFSNVSHEFRTPLTLMLGPLEDVLTEARNMRLPEQTTALLRTAHRNGLRLLKLVNSPLDFSRIEAGRVNAKYEPVDLASLTAELASNFRSACEKAGLSLKVDCPNLGREVYVDRDMWEKIVLNLISNAFKFTFDGEITVSTRIEGGNAVLRVTDTGTGAPKQSYRSFSTAFIASRAHAAAPMKVPASALLSCRS